MAAEDRVAGDVVPADRRFFFIHVMKTGGTSLWYQARQSLGSSVVYPDASIDPIGPYEAYMSIDYLLSLPQARLDRIRCFMGHFPYYVTDMLGGDFVTMSILRHPVDRTVSFLKHWRTQVPSRSDLSLEELYDNEIDRRNFAMNHQTRIFSMTAEDGAQNFLDWIDIDAQRLKNAKANVDRVDVLGVQEHYDRFLERLEQHYGLVLRGLPRQLVSAYEEVPDALRRRILDDNAADLELYEHARERLREP
jgi:hypothetical protein